MFAGVWGLWQVAGLLPQTREAIPHPHKKGEGLRPCLSQGTP